MKKYKLVEKAIGGANPIIYEIEDDRFSKLVTLKQCFMVANKPITVSTEIIENNRGWTYETAILTGEFIKVFLPRARFNKVEI